MSDPKRLEIITGLAGPLADSLGLTLWGVEEALVGRKGVVRIYLDRRHDSPVAPTSPDAPDNGHGVSVDDCAEVSRALSAALDIEDIFPGAYDLEVSSPGLDRLFFSIEQIAGYVGEEVRLTMDEPFEDRKRFRGKLLAVRGEILDILADGREFAIPWALIKKAQLVYKFQDAQPQRKPGGKGRKTE